MIRREEGFTLVELMIAMVMFVFVIAATSQIFTGLLTQFKQQSKIAETNIEGIVGLDMMRRDLEHAGYGLPWVIPGTVAYNEASAAEAAAFNDCSGSAPCNPPRAIVSGNSMTYSSPNNVFNGSDYLVIKASNVATSDTAQRWTTLRTGGAKIDDLSGDSFENTDRVIVISPGTTDADSRELIVGVGWYTTYNATLAFAPGDATETHVIYGIDPDTNLRMPFNRADYYIWRDGTTSGTDKVPDRCAFGTGILRKTVIAHGDGDRIAFPLLDCVADMQVVLSLDMNDDGAVGTYVSPGATEMNSSEGSTTLLVQQTLADASLLRNRLMDIRVYILAHEGQRDPNFTYTTNPVTVGEFGVGRNFNFTDPNGDGNTSDAITDWQNYRWKIYTIVVKPNNLR